MRRLGECIPSYLPYLELMFSQTAIDATSMFATAQEVDAEVANMQDHEGIEHEPEGDHADGDEAEEVDTDAVQHMDTPSAYPVNTPSNPSSRKRSISPGISNSDNVPKRSKSPSMNRWNDLIQQQESAASRTELALYRIAEGREKTKANVKEAERKEIKECCKLARAAGLSDRSSEYAKFSQLISQENYRTIFLDIETDEARHDWILNMISLM